MRIVDRFSFAGATEILSEHYASELAEVEAAIAAVDAQSCRVKETKEKTLQGLLYAPIAINYCLMQKQLYRQGWDSTSRKCVITKYFPATNTRRRIQLSMDGIKHRVGLEIQLGKYSFLEYDVLAKMPIYQKLGLIQAGIEVVFCNRLISNREVSTGVGDFERLVTILLHRGERSEDFPVLVLGIDVDEPDAVRTLTVSFQADVLSNLQGTRPGPGKK